MVYLHKYTGTRSIFSSFFLSNLFLFCQVIEQHGGQVDNAYSNRVTHLLCATQHTDVFHIVCTMLTLMKIVWKITELHLDFNFFSAHCFMLYTWKSKDLVNILWIIVQVCVSECSVHSLEFWGFVLQFNCIKQALKDQRRVVTAFWLNDVLVKKKMLPPYQALHLPIIYGENKPCSNQVNDGNQINDCKKVFNTYMYKQKRY